MYQTFLLYKIFDHHYPTTICSLNETFLFVCLYIFFYVYIILLYNLFCWVHNRNFSIHAQKQYSIKDVNKMCRFHYGPLCLDHIEIYMQNKIVLTFMCASAAPGPGHAWGVLKKSELHFYCLKSYTYMYRQRNTDTRVLITF